MIVQVLKGESYQLTLGHSSYAEIKPSLIIITFHVGCCVMGNPQVKGILLVATLGSREIARAELTAEDNLGVWDLPAGPRWIGV